MSKSNQKIIVPLPPRRRGRPTNADRAARALLEAAGNAGPVGEVIEHVETDEELLDEIKFRFALMTDMTKAIIAGDIRSLIASGAPGMSKTFTIEGVLEKAVETDGIKVEIVKGVMTPIQFYKILYRNREKNNVILLDDVDIFKDEQSLALAKAAFDTSITRRITWASETNALKEEDIPRSFVYNGAAIFITNVDFQTAVDQKTGKIWPHLDALMSRSSYLDLKLHETRPKMVWIRYITETFKMLEPQGLTTKETEEVLTYMSENKDRFRNLSLRTAIKIAHYYKMNKLNWKRTSEMMLMR
jgi:hypothetical protein